MTPVIVGTGTSFKGLANYVLHDPDQATTSDRVAWTETRNLGTDDPHLAWRVMAATSMKQADLKKQAGIPNTGRKSKHHVLHLVLSWSPEEKDSVSREEMMRATNAALRYLKADDRQVIIAAHNDGDQPHLHAVINRVSTEDGRLLSSSWEKEQLSKWALEYEKERGKIYCKNREANRAARKRGEYTRGSKRVPRHIFELEAANQNKPGIEQIKTQQKKLDAALAKQNRDRDARRGKEWTALYQARKKAFKAIQEQKKRDLRAAQQKVREEFRSKWLAHHDKQRKDLSAFDAREKTLAGRLSNMVKGVDLKGIVRGKTRRDALSKAYSQIASAGKRREEFLSRQKVEERRLEQQQKAAEKTRQAEVRRQKAQEIAERRTLFLAERSSLVFKHDMENAAHKKQWEKRNDERRAAYEQIRNRDAGGVQRSDGVSRPAANENTKGPSTEDVLRAAERIKNRQARQKSREKDQEKDLGDDLER